MPAIMDIFLQFALGAGIWSIYDPLDILFSINFLYVYMRLKYVIRFLDSSGVL